MKNPFDQDVFEDGNTLEALMVMYYEKHGLGELVAVIAGLGDMPQEPSEVFNKTPHDYRQVRRLMDFASELGRDQQFQKAS